MLRKNAVGHGISIRFLMISSALLVACGGSVETRGDPADDGGVDSGDATIDPLEAGVKPDANDAEAAVPQYTGPVMISKKKDSTFEAETQLAVAPDGRIAVAWIALTVDSGPRIGYSFSLDDGASFTPVKYVDPPKLGLAGTDPSMAVDAKGNFYLSLIGLQYSPTGEYGDMHVYVSKAPAGSATFGTPVEATEPGATTDLNDHPKISVSEHGTIVVAYMHNASGVAARSADGVNWQSSTVTNEWANLFWICDGGGNLYATFVGDFGVELRTSSDEGATWSPDSTMVSLPNEYAAFMDPTCVASGDDVWVSYGTTPANAWTEETLDPASMLYVAHSPDRGSTFPTRVSAFDAASGKLAVHPVLVRETGGALDLTYISGAAAMDSKSTLRLARAATGTFAPSVTVDSPLVLQLDRVGIDWLGDYMGFVKHGATLYFAYPKNSTGMSHVWFAKHPAQ